MCFPPSNLPLIISVASPTSSHPLLFLYWHCHRHRPWLSHPSLTPSLPSSLNPSHHIDSALPQEHLSLSLHPPHCLPTHPLSVGVSGHPAGRFITATSQQQSTLPRARARARTHTHTHTHTHIRAQTNKRTHTHKHRHTHTHDFKQIQSNKRKTKPRQEFYNERDGKGLVGYNLLFSHPIVISDH